MGKRGQRRTVKADFYKQLNANKKFLNADVIAEVAEEFDLPFDTVKGIVDAQFKFTAQTIKGGGLETIMFVYLGKFKVNPRQVQKIRANGARR